MGEVVSDPLSWEFAENNVKIAKDVQYNGFFEKHFDFNVYFWGIKIKSFLAVTPGFKETCHIQSCAENAEEE